MAASEAVDGLGVGVDALLESLFCGVASGGSLIGAGT